VWLSIKTTRLNLSHNFTPACALQQAVCDVADGVSLDEVHSKLLVDIRSWNTAIGHQVNEVEAIEIASHISKDFGRQFSATLMPMHSYFETKEQKASETLARMEAKATSILEDAYKSIMGPWPGYRASAAAQSPRP
jgi:hypothetical protein